METNIVGGDNVEGDKITAEIGNDVVGVAVGKNITQTIHYHHVKPQPVTGEILKAATVKLADLPLDQIPTVATLPAGSQMPFSHNPLFVGREEELRSLATVLKGGQTAAVGQTAAATGMGGIGKTQLAVAFVHRYGQFFRGGVFWISMADPAAIPAEIVACGAKMSELRSDYAALEFDTQLGLVLSAWQNELPRLLVFDNCEDSALFAYWRPPTGECRVLVTSRRSSWDIGLNVRVLPLDTLTRPQSLELLAKYPEQASPPVPRFTEEEGESLNQIADELGDLPLALHLAGSFLARYRHSVTLDSYLSQLRSPDLLKHPSLQFKGYNPTGHEQHVARTFSLSYEQLDRAEPIDAQALDLLVRTAHFAPGEPIPRNLLVSTMGQSPSPITLLRRVLLSGMAIIFPIKWRIAIFGKALLEETDASDIALQAEDTLQRLGDLGLVELEATGAVRLHRLIATFVINTTTEDVDTARAAVESTVLTEANRLNSTGIPGPLLAWQIHLRHVTGNAIAKKSGNTAALCNTLAALLRMIGQFTEAWPYLEQALDIRRAALGEQHPVTATSLNNIGILLRDMGEFAEARPYLEQVLDIRRATLGEQHPDTAMSLNNLGGLLRDMGQFAEARPYFEQALDIRQAALGEQHPNIAMSLNNIGMLLRDMGE
ncbi:MAG: tetratricopeptide repeat protein, partial [Caldilineaceae bacterium]|nr:tetratricopeptide repeat protein [Caldilineaceae bacterium]